MLKEREILEILTGIRAQEDSQLSPELIPLTLYY